MKSHEQGRRGDDVLFEYAVDHLDWPDTVEELDAFLADQTNADPYSEAEIAARTIRILGTTRDGSSPSGHGGDGGQGQLFSSTSGQFEVGSEENAKRAGLFDLYELVRQAYLQVADKCSIDRVIADPEHDARFVQTCWTLGAVRGQNDLNLALLGARKNGLIGKVEGVESYRVPRAVMDQYLHACEIALRILEDREFLSHHRSVSRDRVLCEPELGKRFVDLASVIAPGYTALDYRWALLTICKRINLQGAQGQLPKLAFEPLGRRDSIRPSQIASGAGFFWMRSKNADVYIGHGENIRGLLGRILDLEFDWASEARSLFDVGDLRRVEFAVALCPGLPVSERDNLKRTLVRTKVPRLNFIARAG